MSDPNPDLRNPPPPHTPPPPESPRGSGPGAMLWIIILLLLVAAVWYFMGRRDDSALPPPDTTPIGDTAPVPSQSPVSDPDRERADRERARPAPAPVTREPQLLDQAPPEYPAAAARSGVEGTVRVRVEVGADGKPTDVSIAQSSRSRDLDRAALAAVRQWTFQPAMRDGQPVASAVEVPVEFSLGQR